MNTDSKNLPLVSIVIPVYNDEKYIARALDSCLAQTLKDIEVICVDDASSDGSVKVIKRYIERDSRIRLIEQTKNSSALQARRVGIEAARARYILFLDGDDRLDSRLAEKTYNEAVNRGADVVSFSPELVFNDGRTAEHHQASLVPPSGELFGVDIVASVFEPGTHAQGNLWRYLFDKSLLAKAYNKVPKDKAIYRANDTLISFVALAYADHYVNIPEALYMYHMDDGGSGHNNIDYDKFLFYAQGIDSVECIPGMLSSDDFTAEEFEVIQACYTSLRLKVIATTIKYGIRHIQTKYKDRAVDYILSRTSYEDIVLSLGTFYPGALSILKDRIEFRQAKRKIKRVIIFSSNLSTGGAQGVALSQAIALAGKGYSVMMLVRNGKKIAFDIPSNIEIRVLRGSNDFNKLKDFLAILRDFKPGVFIDHYVLYNQTWPFYMLLAKLHGAKGIGWMHNFAIRPTHDLSRMGVFLQDHVWILDTIVTLSKRDTAYWKILGHDDVCYLPNPPSPLLVNNPPAINTKKAPGKTVNLIWYGRLQQDTKRVYSLLSVSRALLKMTPNFKLTIIGPESGDITYDSLRERIVKFGLENNVFVVGEKRGADLVSLIQKAHIFLSTSSIEGYPLVITEVQAFGLPVVMYELPWIDFIKGNKGIVEVGQNNSTEAARRIFELLNDPGLYGQMSKGSLLAANEYLSHDFAQMYDQLIKGTLPNEYSPEPTIDDARFFFEWYNYYVERNSIRVDELRQRSLRYRKDSVELRALKRSLAHKLGQSAAAPIRLIKQMVDRG